MPHMDGVRGELRRDEDMSLHTSWRAGGRAQWYFIPDGRDDLCRFLARLPADTAVLFTGLGSNLLVRDGGLTGVVVATHRALSTLRVESPGLVFAEAGVACAKVARFTNRHGLAGAEFLAGIPGCIGGALAMNAGAFGGETWCVVESVELVRRDGRTRRATPAEFDVGYRRVALGHDEWFIGARIRLSPGDVETSRGEIARLLKRRGATQPVQTANAGSVFTNPPGDHAARLIEACGLKGLRVGNAEVSQKHANFIINLGGACAADIECLIERVRQRVRSKTGVDLHPEVRIVGNRDD
ncbi:MAG: UDP-N-acetylmuramate dehydrogenase [Proteobacteria bacterium]|nr:MAG: UDP-N-acetylmuramate dehydrogenase [Pseudomonadota bacterium]